MHWIEMSRLSLQPILPFHAQLVGLRKEGSGGPPRRQVACNPRPADFPVQPGLFGVEGIELRDLFLHMRN